MKLFLTAVACALACLASPTPRAKAQDGVRQSVVKVISTLRAPNLGQPWTKAGGSESSGTGFVIDGNRILTNYHVVAYASQIYVQPHDTADRIAAEVVINSAEMDLAILSVEDASFFEQRPPLELAAELPAVRSAVNVYGYPIGGSEMSVTEGIVSRIEFSAYYCGGTGLQIQIDAAINPGNSGGPAIADGKVVGVAFRGIPTAENIGFLIPIEEVNGFLEDIADGTYDGKPQLANEFQPTDNDALRASLKLPGDVGGCELTRVLSLDPQYPLRVRDVVTKIGPHEIDRRGQVRISDDLRVFFTYYVPKLAEDGEVPLTVYRDGEPMEIRVPTVSRLERVAPYLRGGYPEYFIVGPLVFSTVSQELVTAMTRSANFVPRLALSRSPLLTRGYDTSQFPGERLVFIPTQPFSHRIAKGYTAYGMVLDELNGVPVKNLAHLVELVRDSQDEFLEFTFAEEKAPRYVFRRQEMIDATEEILTDNGIRHQCSEELRAVWEIEE